MRWGGGHLTNLQFCLVNTKFHLWINKKHTGHGHLTLNASSEQDVRLVRLLLIILQACNVPAQSAATFCWSCIHKKRLQMNFRTSLVTIFYDLNKSIKN